MITVAVDKELDVYPQEVSFADDDGPLPCPEEELMSLEEFGKHLEKRVFERLGIKLNLSLKNDLSC